ncbi:hypothetical protein D4R52_01635 [bacterium]|nr:MAG: hypothetical protein D4R52_01635 [bacterium]
MVDQIVFAVKLILLTEALTHAVRSWGIFDGVRSRITSKSDFLRRLLACYECSAVWTVNVVFLYLYFLDFWPITFTIIAARLATIAHIVIDLVDAWRAATINRI